MVTMDRNDVEELCKFLGDDERSRLFDLLYDVVGKRKPEEISLALGVKLQAVYRYFQQSRRRVVPNYRTAAKIIRALMERAENDVAISFLDLAAERMRGAHYAYVQWRRKIASEAPLFPYKPLERITHRRRLYDIFEEDSHNPDWRDSLIGALTSAGFPLSSVPERCEEAIASTIKILNYARQPEPTKEMKRRAVEEGLGKLYSFFIEYVEGKDCHNAV